MDFIVDFRDVKDKRDVILRLSEVFKLHDISGHSWDSFEDFFTSLNPDSEIIRNANPMPEAVHLVVKNVEAVKKVSGNDYDILLSILDEATRPESRGDKILFSYELK